MTTAVMAAATYGTAGKLGPVRPPDAPGQEALVTGTVVTVEATTADESIPAAARAAMPAGVLMLEGQRPFWSIVPIGLFRAYAYLGAEKPSCASLFTQRGP